MAAVAPFVDGFVMFTPKLNRHCHIHVWRRCRGRCIDAYTYERVLLPRTHKLMFGIYRGPMYCYVETLKIEVFNVPVDL